MTFLDESFGLVSALGMAMLDGVIDGRITELGTHEELLERGGLYADLHRTQFAVGEGRTVGAA